MGYLILKYISDRSVTILTIVASHCTNNSLHVDLCCVSATQNGKSIGLFPS